MGMHPCLSCGACCAFFRVSFYWREAEEGLHPVPLSLTEDYSSLQRNMLGTNQKKPRCVALGGKIGERVGCAIYESRPSPCRAFAASYENGEPNARCDDARAQYGMKPLQPADWLELRPAVDRSLSPTVNLYHAATPTPELRRRY